MVYSVRYLMLTMQRVLAEHEKILSSRPSSFMHGFILLIYEGNILLCLPTCVHLLISKLLFSMAVFHVVVKPVDWDPSFMLFMTLQPSELIEARHAFFVLKRGTRHYESVSQFTWCRTSATKERASLVVWETPCFVVEKYLCFSGPDVEQKQFHMKILFFYFCCVHFTLQRKNHNAHNGFKTIIALKNINPFVVLLFLASCMLRLDRVWMLDHGTLKDFFSKLLFFWTYKRPLVFDIAPC